MTIVADDMRKAIRHSRRLMEKYLKERKEAIRQFVGKHFSDDGSDDRIPIPLLSVAVNIYSRSIVARAPRYLVTSDKPPLRPSAADFQILVNQSIEHSGLEAILRSAAKQALFGFAMVKTGLEASKTIQTNELTGQEEIIPVGEPFTALVDPDDAVIDMTAKSWSEIEFIGHRFRVPFDSLKASGVYSEEQLQKLRSNQYSSEARSSDISTGGNTPEGSELFPRVALWEIYVPGENKIYVLPDSDGDFLREPEEWTGPDNPLGPYRFLGLSEAPGQLLPVPPTAWWMDLHLAANALWRKIIRQGERHKTLGLVYGDEEAGAKVRDARDGEIVTVPQSSKVEEQAYGEPNQLLTMLGIKLRGEFSYLAQMDVIGGMAPSAETLGQDKLIHATASQLVDDMQDQMVKFARDIGHDHAYFQFFHNTREIEMVKRIKGYDIGIPVKWNPWEDRGDFLDYQFDIEPYSLRGSTPGQQMQTLMSTLQALLPLAPMLQAQGKQIDGSAIVDSIAKYTNSPDIAAIVVDSALPEQGMDEQQMGAPTQTSRTYTRKNVSTKTPGGQDEVMMQNLMSSARSNGSGSSMEGMA